MVSAVPAGDVMAREDVFGMVRPCAATIGTTIIEVRLPGIPPMQCLSTTIGLSQVKFRAGLSHGVGQRQQLVAGQEARGADQERRDFHVGIAIMNEVVDDRADLAGGQSSALNFGANSIDTGRRRRRRHRNLAAGGLGKSTECRLGQAEVVGADQTVIVGDDQGGEQRFRIVTHFDPAEAAKHFGPQGLRAPRHDGDVFPAGVEIDPTDPQLRT